MKPLERLLPILPSLAIALFAGVSRAGAAPPPAGLDANGESVCSTRPPHLSSSACLMAGNGWFQSGLGF